MYNYRLLQSRCQRWDEELGLWLPEECEVMLQQGRSSMASGIRMLCIVLKI